ncbi:MAG: putative signaling protein, partial [Friedmanniella sp.]|nr:putative signaling protein [Friedmanniella sp.]
MVSVLFLVGLIASLAYVLATLLTTRAQRPPAVDTWLYIGLEVVPVALIVARSVWLPAERPAWLLLAAGVACIPVGDTIFTVLVEPASPRPSPSPDTGWYLAFLVLTFAALVLLLRRRLPPAPSAGWLDGLIGGLGIVAVGAAALFDDVLRHSPTRWAAVSGLAYPIGPLVLVALLTGALTVL